MISKKSIFIILIALVSAHHAAYGYVSLETRLMKAAEKGNTRTMRKLIDSGADVNAIAFCDQPHAGYPVLRYAIDNGNLKAVQLLLKEGANPNVLTESPIITDNGKDNVRNLSLLSHAVNDGASIAIIKALINAGADINGKPYWTGTWTPLMIAAYRGNVQAIAILIDAGADLSIINESSHKTALDYAEKTQDFIIKVLKKQKKLRVNE